MKNRILIIILNLAYWYVIFAFARIAFLLVYFEKSMQLSVFEILDTFIHGFKLDIAIAAYIIFIPTLSLALTTFFKTAITRYLIFTYTFVALFVSASVILGDLFMYKHWGFRMDATPLFYMSNLKAMTASVNTMTVIGGITAVILTTLALFYGYVRLFEQKLSSLSKSNKAFFVLFPVILFLIVLMRGGLGIASLTTSTAYFSKNQFANHAAINPVWNVGFSVTESDDLNRKYTYFSESEMNKTLEPLKESIGTLTGILKTNRPNIILIITESLTAKAVEATGGRSDIMPCLNQLVKEGVIFNQVYASSDRTDKGLAAVLAGYPSLPGSSPLKYQKLTEKLTFIPNKLNAAGYRSEFFYGGTLEFANYRSFLVQAGFDKMVSDRDFPASDLKSKWGAFDHVVFNKFLTDTPDDDKNFFKTILTLTSHEPFETPVEPVFAGSSDETKYLNSLHYTDQAIGNLIKVAKTRKWWNNTLVIIIADHGNRMPGNSEITEKSKYHIPMIWLGGALKVNDTVIDKLASQTDVAATILAQLQLNADGLNFSRNILSSGFTPYSFFTFSNGFGFLKPDNLLIYNTITNSFAGAQPGLDIQEQKQGKAYLQYIYQDFYNKNK